MSVLLVVAKAPVAGLAKTRLGAVIGASAAADLAAAALLDTLDAVRAVPDTTAVVAMTGEPRHASRAGELAEALRGCVVIPQRGKDFAERLANAHADVAARFPAEPVFQVGMDTPQLTPRMLAGALVRLADTDAVLGPATDGGWWGLGLRDPRAAEVLRSVPMSRSDTGTRTLFALRGTGIRVEQLAPLSDVDTLTDAVRVGATIPESRFAAALAELSHWLPREYTEAVAR
jgi:uncharacterized protein